MNIKESNITIAKFMGCTDIEWKVHGDGGNHVLMAICPVEAASITRSFRSNTLLMIKRFDRSLDTLVHVWKKLEDYDSGDFFCEKMEDDTYRVTVNSFDKKGECRMSVHYGKIIQEAAAIATATAIEEL